MLNHHLINAKKIIVIGDGPAAMITCIKLAQLGVTDITLIGPRIGYYIRSGEFNHEVFESVNKIIYPLSIKIPPSYYGSSANYIRNLEKQLYTHIKQLNIKCVKKKFVTFINNKQIKLANPQNSSDTELIETDLVLDCTGAKRAIIKELNKQSPTAPFQITPVSDISYDFAMARFDYTSKDTSQVKQAKKNLVDEILLLIKLRRLGWPFYILPAFYHFDWESNNPKQNLYFRYHPNATPDTIKEMACLLESYHSLYFDDEKINANTFFHTPSKNYPDKKIISTFKLAPCLTTPSCYEGSPSLPIVIPLGDSLLNVPFIYAKSLITFTHVLKQLTLSFIIEDGVITKADFQHYDQQIQNCLASPLKEIKEGFSNFAEKESMSSIYEKTSSVKLL
ncbi:Uncharacterised protein [Legionella busanensis]|uniref:Uncharacterized protein n=1 Tax=Legionella busanensis TaxID=190655 RepID=A0A378JJT4_9GAMM|nr:hypothetical protein [Legionella busanensis]STX51586.1 Uncharacterised protein [Legionella busanensis]